MVKMITKNNIKYLIVGDKAIPLYRIGPKGPKPIKAKKEIKIRPDGTKEIRIHIPCLKVALKDKGK